MSKPLEHPHELDAFGAAESGHVRRWGWGMLAVWLLILALDWTARFRWFRWQDQWVWIRPAAERVSSPPSEQKVTSRRIPAQWGAGLTQMVPVRRIADRYAEHHPEYVVFRDERGYPNPELPPGARHDAVMVGDSFLLSLGTQNVAQVLSSIGGISLYNRGRMGVGPFRELERHIRFPMQLQPRVVIWNLSGRELDGGYFSRQPIEAWFRGVEVWADYTESMSRSHVRWIGLTPKALSQAWPNTSMLAYASRKGWAQVKLVVFGEWPRDVLGADDPQFGPMLFYRENLRVLPRLDPEGDAPAVVSTVLKVAKGFRERGETLVVLLVPEKEQIHVGALSAEDQNALARGPELMAAIESGLTSEGVSVVNLMPVFQGATARGERLYWRDDTHWNDAGIRLAAEELWRIVEPLLE